MHQGHAHKNNSPRVHHINYHQPVAVFTFPNYKYICRIIYHATIITLSTHKWKLVLLNCCIGLWLIINLKVFHIIFVFQTKKSTQSFPEIIFHKLLSYNGNFLLVESQILLCIFTINNIFYKYEGFFLFFCKAPFHVHNVNRRVTKKSFVQRGKHMYRIAGLQCNAIWLK